MIPVLDHGYVRLRDYMGSDLSVVDAARVSFNKRSAWESLTWDLDEPTPERIQPTSITSHGNDWCQGLRLSEKDSRLIQFLAKHEHWSPFAHATLSFEVKCPMVVKNQWIKHRIGMGYLTDEDAEAWDNEGWNEMSMRYVSPEDFYLPAIWRRAPANRKQGSGEDMNEHESGVAQAVLRSVVLDAINEYEAAIESGQAPEQARLLLPMYAMYTSYIWTTSLYGVVRFLKLRTKEDSQYEIREYANVVHELVKPLFPESLAAFDL